MITLDPEAKDTIRDLTTHASDISCQTNYHGIDETNVVVEVQDLSLWYGQTRALTDVSLKFPRNKITALIGPSGCGKSTLLRSINRMNDLIKGVRTEGRVLLEGKDIYGRGVDPVEVRRRVGMVFQKPNPFPRSIKENILYGAKINGYKGNFNDLVEWSLRQAALWDEVKDNLNKSGLALSGGQQQRLCIARAIALQPDVLLMDEPASALDPISTLKIEDLMQDLVKNYTIVIVTHNMQQAARVSDYTGFMLSDEKTRGQLVEFGPSTEIFSTPKEKRTEDYITGRFG
ncbi:MAG TPA: phosphate ABC transporter ATP-binding protein PstB [Chloroflexia bacterium]|nr:phosphate ABC transporter ATP-binding protein PstB [Chloroflexia bacterium]